MDINMYSFSTKGISSNPVSKEAIKKFNERFAYAKENYFAKQES